MQEQEIYLRIRAWWGWNDRFRGSDRPPRAIPLDPRMAANLVALQTLLNADPERLLMRVEIAREFGKMEEAERLLSTPLPSKYAAMVEQMRSWIAAGDSQVRRFRDNRPSEAEREAEFQQHTAENA